MYIIFRRSDIIHHYTVKNNNLQIKMCTRQADAITHEIISDDIWNVFANYNETNIIAAEIFRQMGKKIHNAFTALKLLMDVFVPYSISNKRTTKLHYF
jgi:hypothetical protein